MVNLDELYARAQKASDQASAQLEESIRKSQEMVQKMEEESEERNRQREEAQKQSADQSAAANRQVEILGQLFGADVLQQSAAMEEQIRAEVERQVSDYTALSAEAMMGKLLGDDMGIIAAALETLAQEEDVFGDEDEEELSPKEQYGFLEAKMAEVQSLSEPPPTAYGDDGQAWLRFGILLSGIISRLNQHELSTLDVEEHIPVMEQQISTVVRNSWGIRGREGLLDTLRYLTQEGYRLRYQVYADAAAAEDLFHEDMDPEDRESVRMGWNFVQHFKDTYPAEFLLGWDVGRAAMLTRWGYFLGWLTQEETLKILSDLSQMATDGLNSWRAFARSYQFGGMFWKFVCQADDGVSYLKSLTQAITELLSDAEDDCDGGQWKNCPWPAAATLGCH